MSQSALNLFDNTDKIIDVEPAARGTCNYGHTARAQSERLNNFPGDAHLLNGVRGERDPHRVADAELIGVPTIVTERPRQKTSS